MSKQYGFLFDPERCVDCRACVSACKTVHQIETGIAWRHVQTVWRGSFPQVSFRSTSMACNHCAEPACVAACPSGALSKRAADGVVVVDKSKCIGCKMCSDACSYHAPQFGKDGMMQKCEFCIDRIAAEKKPACVSTCQGGALQFGLMEELAALAGAKHVQPMEGATRPSLLLVVAGK